MVEPERDHTSRIIRARLFGLAEVRVGTRLLTAPDWGTRGARPFLLYLLLSSHHRAGRDEIQDLLWPSLDPEAGRNALYKAIHSVRRILEPGLAAGRASSYIITSPDVIALRDDVTVVTDTGQFQADVQRASHERPAEARRILRSSLGNYRGDVLEDIPYADWPIAERERLRRQRESATLTLAELDLEAGAPGLSAPYLEALLQAEPGNERAHRAMMRAYLAQGERALVLRQFERCRAALAEQFGVAPNAQTADIADEARRETTERVARAANAPSPGAPFTNLPAPPTPTVGRASEIDDVYDILARSPARLVTIVGGGGIGKTRLAIEVASELGSSFADGVALAQLASLADPHDVPGTVARTLGLTVTGRRPPGELVIDFLRDRQMLLVLDNLEHLAGAAAWIAEVVERCHRVRIMATSRVPLRIRAEQVYRIGGLDVPDLGQPFSARTLQHVDSVALFSQAARARTIDFRVDDHNAGSIARLCAALDGAPLSIELAASRVGDLTLESIEAQLARPLAMLVEGPVDLPERQRTLSDTIAWSYTLLSPEEQHLFRNLGAFAGGAELDALRTVCGADAEAVATALVEASLATWQGVGEGRRLVMHQALFEFAATKLDESPDSDATRRRHANFYARLAATAERELRAADQVAWLDRLDRDIQNLRQAMTWSIEHGESELALTISGRIGWFWNTRGRPREGFEWMSRALAAPGDPWSAERANTASRAARCAWFIDDSPTHDRLLQEALAIWDHNQDQLGQVWGLSYRIGQLWRDGNTREATSLQRTSMDLFRAAGHWGLVSDGLIGLAMASREEGDDEAANAFLLEALVTVDQSHDISTRAFASIHLAVQMHFAGDPEASIRHAEEGERVAWLLGDKDLAANAIYERAIATLEHGDPERALALFEESEALFVECDTSRDAALAALYAAGVRLCAGDRAAAASGFARAFAELRSRGRGDDPVLCAEAGAGLAMALGMSREALRLVGYATCQRAQANMRRTPFAIGLLGDLSGAAATVLGGATARRATSEGEAMSEADMFDLLDRLAEEARDVAAASGT